MALIDKLIKGSKNVYEKRNKKVSLSLTVDEFNILNEYSKLTNKSKQELLHLACIEAGLFKQYEGMKNE